MSAPDFDGYHDPDDIQGGGELSAAAKESCSLEQLMVQHRIAVSPEFESALWHAEVYDNESATPTRKATGATPTAAVLEALKQPIPEYGDALDTINQ